MDNKKNTGTSMNGTMEYTRNVKAKKCNCKMCFHAIKKNKIWYCQYYDLFSPDKTKCVRYSLADKYQKKEKEEVKRKKPSLPWERP